MRATFLTYANESFRQAAGRLADSAVRVGFDKAIVLGPDFISGGDFFQRNESTLRQKRGAGYWLWKPYVILNTLRSFADGEVLFYCDAGRNSYYEFDRFPETLIQLAAANTEGFLAGVEIPHIGPIETWTKRDCLVLMEADVPEVRRASQVQATWSVWTKNPKSVRFLQSWLKFCEDPRCLTDNANSCGLPNYPTFRDHRHDQSVLSVLCRLSSSPTISPRTSIMHRAIELRPFSNLGQNFYKRPSNIEAMLQGNGLGYLMKQYFQMRNSKQNG